MRLTVHQSAEEDIYKDLVRVPEIYRLDSKGKHIPEGSICQITVATTGNSKLTSVRGCKDDGPIVRMDEKVRTDLCVVPEREYEFRLRRVWWFGQCRWAWQASDPAYRLAARLGVLSVLLGLIGLCLGIAGCWLALRQD
jgi:hypothetical protein